MKLERPLTVKEMKARLAAGESLRSEDLIQIRWLRTAKTIRMPTTAAQTFIAELADTTRIFREKHSLTCKALAERCGIHYSYISQVENGLKSDMTLSNAIRLAEACGQQLELKLKPAKKRLRRAA